LTPARAGSSFHAPQTKSIRLFPVLITTLSLLAVGFFLGMRHATDADHVIAISTIVSRQRSLRRRGG